MPATRKWWFFRFHGLRVIDETTIDWEHFTFDDVEIVSPATLAGFIVSTTANDLTMQRQLLEGIGHRLMRPADAFLIVSKMVPEGAEMKQWQEKAFLRARKIAALLAVYRLMIGKLPVSCGLARDVNHNFSDSLRFDMPAWQLDFAQGGRISFAFPEPESLTKVAISSDLNGSAFSALTQFVLRPQSLRLSHKLNESLLRLASGIWANEPESMLLGAFTATEMLLGSAGHDRLKDRIRLLLGEQLSITLKLDEVSQARHDYVHRGVAVEVELGLISIALAFSVILSYAKLAFSLSEGVCTSDLVDLLLDLSNRVPPITIEQLQSLFASRNLTQHRPSFQPQFFEPAVSQAITLPTPDINDTAALVDVLIRDYFGICITLGIQPDWNDFRNCSFYQIACGQLSLEAVEQGIVRFQSMRAV